MKKMILYIVLLLIVVLSIIGFILIQFINIFSIMANTIILAMRTTQIKNKTKNISIEDYSNN